MGRLTRRKMKMREAEFAGGGSAPAQVKRGPGRHGCPSPTLFFEATARALAAAAVLATLLAALPARAEFDPAKWRYYMETQLPDPNEEGFVGLPLKEAVFDHAARGLGDLRLVGPGGDEIPYVLVKQEGRVVTENITPEILNRSVEGEWQQLVADLGERGIRNNQAELSVADQNFKRPAEIYGSDDGENWALVRGGFYIFSFRGDVSVSDTTLRYPENIFRYLKIRIGLKGGDPLDIGAVSVRSHVVENREIAVYKQLAFTMGEDAELEATEIVVEFAHKNLPMTEIVFNILEPEFYRTVQVFRDRERKRKVAESVIYRYTVKDYVAEDLRVTFPETALEEAYILILNHDSKPLAVRTLVASGPRRVLVFRPPAEGGVRLYYGADKVQAPVYDLARLYPRIKDDPPELGYFVPGEKRNPAYAKHKAAPPPEEPRDYSWMLWLVIVPAGALLAYLVLRSVKEIEAGGGEGSEDGEE